MEKELMSRAQQLVKSFNEVKYTSELPHAIGFTILQEQKGSEQEDALVRRESKRLTKIFVKHVEEMRNAYARGTKNTFHTGVLDDLLFYELKPHLGSLKAQHRITEERIHK